MLPALLHFTLGSFWYLSYQAYPGSNTNRFLKSDTIHKAKKNAFKMLAASLIDESSKFEVNWVFYFSSVCHRKPIKRPPDEADPAQLAETVKVSFFNSCPFVGEFGCSKKGRLWLEPRWTDSSETTNIQEILVGSGKRRRKSWRNSNRLLVSHLLMLLIYTEREMMWGIILICNRKVPTCTGTSWRIEGFWHAKTGQNQICLHLNFTKQGTGNNH